MSKKCKLQKEYYKKFGNYKGNGKYTDHYVNWLESKVLALTIPVVSESFNKSDLLDLGNWFDGSPEFVEEVVNDWLNAR